MLFNILLTGLTAYVVDILWYHHCEFWSNSSTTDQVSCIWQIL